MEYKIALLLRYGVYISGALMLMGWLSNIDLGAHPFQSFQVYQELPLTKALSQAYAQESYARIFGYLGLFCLISLPILRVMFAAILFAKDKEWILAGLASLVLCGLLFSFALGIHL